MANGLTPFKPLSGGGGLRPMRPFQPAMAGTGYGGKSTTADNVVAAIDTSAFETPSVKPEPQGAMGWLKQQGKDLVAPITGLPDLLAGTWEGVKDLPWALREIAATLQSDPELVNRSTKGVLREAWRLTTDHYRDPKTGEWTLQSTIGALKNRPVLVTQDLLALASLGATGAGAMAGAATKLGMNQAALKLAKVASKLRAVEAAPYRLIMAGARQLEKIPLVNKAESMLGIDPLSRRLNKTAQAMVMEQMKPASNEMRRTSLEVIPREKWKLFHDVVNFKSVLRRVDWTEQEWSAIAGLRDSLQRIRHELVSGGFDMESGPLTPTALDEAHVRKLVLEDRLEQLGISDPETLSLATAIDEELAGAKIDQIKNNPALTDEQRAAAIANTLGEIPPPSDVLSRLPPQHREAAAKLLGKAIGEEERAAMRAKMNAVIAASELEGADALYLPWVESMSFDVGDAIQRILKPSDMDGVQAMANLQRSTRRKILELNPRVLQIRMLERSARLIGMANFWKYVVKEVGIVKNAGELGPKGHRAVPVFFNRWIDDQLVSHALIAQRAGKTPSLPGDIADVGADLLEHVVKSWSDMERKTIWVPEGTARMLEQMMWRSSGPWALMDKITDWWRELVLRWSPGWYVHNLMGNSILQILYGRVPALTRPRDMEAMPAEVARGFMEAERNIGDKLGSQRTARFLRKIEGVQDFFAQWTDGVPRAGIYLNALQDRDRLRKLADSIGPERMAELERSTGGLAKAVSEARSRYLALEAELTSAGMAGLQRAKGVELELLRASAATRQAAIRREMATLKPLFDHAEGAVVEVERWLGGYGRELPFERKYLRRVFPFWTFAKTMTMLAWYLPLAKPGRTWLWHKLTMLAQDAINDERLPFALKDSLLVGFTGDGKAIFVRISGMNPFEMAGWREFGDVPLPKLIQPTNNPFLAAVIKMEGGYDVFGQPAPLEDGEFMDTYGRVYRVSKNQDGTMQAARVSPQRPLLDTIGELIPQVSILNDVLANSGVKIPGGGPKIFIGPDGKPMNPRHWTMALGRLMGSPVQTTDLAAARNRDIAVRRTLIRQAYHAARRERDPETKAQAMKILADLMADPNLKLTK